MEESRYSKISEGEEEDVEKADVDALLESHDFVVPRHREHRHFNYKSSFIIAPVTLCLVLIIGLGIYGAVRLDTIWTKIQKALDVASIRNSTSTEAAKTTAYDLARPYAPTDNPAFLSFLAADWHDPKDPDAPDRYYDNTRMLGYQLMHAPHTKSKYDFVVAVTDKVSEKKIAQLEQDGAKVIRLPTLYMAPVGLLQQYRDQFQKLSFFTMYGTYGRFCYIDADHLIIENMDDIFEDQGAQIQTTRQFKDEIKEDEPPMPERYLFAGHAEGTGHHASNPPPDNPKLLRRIQDPTSGDYVNGGFLVFAPGQEIHDYYMGIANLTDRWNAIWAEQNMFNYCHRRPGNMPWSRLKDEWDTIGPKDIDLLRGSKALHGHFWDEVWTPPLIAKQWHKVYDEMTWFYGNRTSQ